MFKESKIQSPTSLNVGGSELGWPTVLPVNVSGKAPLSAQIRANACHFCHGSGIIVPRWSIKCGMCGGSGVEAKRR